MWDQLASALWELPGYKLETVVSSLGIAGVLAVEAIHPSDGSTFLLGPGPAPTE
jgi:hypothetical protein